MTFKPWEHFKPEARCCAGELVGDGSWVDHDSDCPQHYWAPTIADARGRLVADVERELVAQKEFREAEAARARHEYVQRSAYVIGSRSPAARAVELEEFRKAVALLG